MLAEPAELWVGEPQPPRFLDKLIRCIHESCFHKFQKFSTKLAACFDLLKTDFCLRLSRGLPVQKNDRIIMKKLENPGFVKTRFMKRCDEHTKQNLLHQKTVYYILPLSPLRFSDLPLALVGGF